MAIDTLTVDIVPKTFPFQQQASFNASRYTTVPWGQAIVNELIDTPATGAGNTGLTIIDIALPSDYVSIMRNLQIQMVDAANITWSNAVVGFAYQQPGGDYKTSVAAYPEKDYSWYQLFSAQVLVYDRFGSPRYHRNWTLGVENNYGVTVSEANDPAQIPLWVPPTVDSSFAERQMVIYMYNGTASQPSADLTVRASFDMYTLDRDWETVTP